MKILLRLPDLPEGMAGGLHAFEVARAYLGEGDELSFDLKPQAIEFKAPTPEHASLVALMRELLHVADNGFMAPEVRDEEIRRIRAQFYALTREVGS